MRAGVCICRIIFLTGASNNYKDSFPFVLSFASFCVLHHFRRYCLVAQKPRTPPETSETKKMFVYLQSASNIAHSAESLDRRPAIPSILRAAPLHEGCHPPPPELQDAPHATARKQPFLHTCSRPTRAETHDFINDLHFGPAWYLVETEAPLFGPSPALPQPQPLKLAVQVLCLPRCPCPGDRHCNPWAPPVASGGGARPWATRSSPRGLVGTPTTPLCKHDTHHVPSPKPLQVVAVHGVRAIGSPSGLTERGEGCGSAHGLGGFHAHNPSIPLHGQQDSGSYRGAVGLITASVLLLHRALCFGACGVPSRAALSVTGIINYPRAPLPFS